MISKALLGSGFHPKPLLNQHRWFQASTSFPGLQEVCKHSSLISETAWGEDVIAIFLWVPPSNLIFIFWYKRRTSAQKTQAPRSNFPSSVFLTGSETFTILCISAKAHSWVVVFVSYAVITETALELGHAPVQQPHTLLTKSSTWFCRIAVDCTQVVQAWHVLVWQHACKVTCSCKADGRAWSCQGANENQVYTTDDLVLDKLGCMLWNGQGEIMDLLWFVIIIFLGCYLVIISSQGVAAAWFSQLLLEEKVHGLGF